MSLGFQPETLYKMKDSGKLSTLARGLYRVSDLPPLGNPDLATFAIKVPGSVICLISAPAFHELATQIPNEVYLALPGGAEPPRLDHPALRVFWFIKKAFEFGVGSHKLDGTPVRTTSRWEVRPLPPLRCRNLFGEVSPWVSERLN